ncbi:MAG TPA: hypothetical protein VHX86_13180 [Tepidisphaeraceae bacterium]|jgi:Ca2+/Na+ antiporter|nr:hypothetical protein [Tepidisphaeraceae bacterium]
MTEPWALFGWGRWILLVPGAVFLYIASLSGVDALSVPKSSPGRRAVGHWIPIAAAALVAMSMRRADLAIAIIFATSVGCLSLFIGSIAIVCPDADAPATFRRVWPFALPAALLVLLVGFTGELTWRHGLVLLIEGFALLFAWRELGAEDVAADVGEPKAEPAAGRGFRKANLVLSVCLAFVGAVAVLLGLQRLGRETPEISDTAIVVAILGPLLVLPMLSRGAALAQKKNRAWMATTSAVGVVLLNLCLLLPVIILLWYPISAVHRNGSGLFHLGMRPLGGVSPMPFPWVTWRVDNVVLLLLSFILLPVSMGRWRLGKAEGITLIALYGVYVLMEAAGTMRP